jgi:hypothetical protein
MLERTNAIKKEVLEPITFVLAYHTVFSYAVIGFISLGNLGFVFNLYEKDVNANHVSIFFHFLRAINRSLRETTSKIRPTVFTKHNNQYIL